jgi:hypothetical protein
MVDIEARGPIPDPDNGYVMTELGAVLLDDPTKTFYGNMDMVGDGDHPANVMNKFADWLAVNCEDQPRFISDNNGFDWMFVCWYFWHFIGRNPFGHSSTNLGSLYKGMKKTMFQNFKHLRKTRHTHHPVDDAMGNVEALIFMRDEMGLVI